MRKSKVAYRMGVLGCSKDPEAAVPEGIRHQDSLGLERPDAWRTAGSCVEEDETWTTPTELHSLFEP